MRPYEMVVLLHPDLEIDIDSPVAKLEKMISAQGGTVIKRDNWGKKRLAYKVKGHDFAVYVLFEVSLPTETVTKLDKQLLITDEVIRHLIVTPAEKPEPSTKKPAKADAEVSAEAPAEAEKVAA
jgi:small subunit ribosomal protein S6